MVLPFLFSIFFLSLLAYLLRRRRLSFFFGALFLCGALACGTGFVPSLLLKKLQVYPRYEKPAWQGRTAIFLLGSGGSRWEGGAVTSSIFGYSRVMEAARLFHDCIGHGGACVVVPCGNDVMKLGVTEADLMKRELVGVGVPEASILPENRSRNTFQNAQFARELVQGKGFERYVLVTSGMHMVRAVKMFEHFGLEVLPSPSDEQQALHSVFPQVHNFFLVEGATHELLGIARFYFYNLMGWNAKV